MLTKEQKKNRVGKLKATAKKAKKRNNTLVAQMRELRYIIDHGKVRDIIGSHLYSELFSAECQLDNHTEWADSILKRRQK